MKQGDVVMIWKDALRDGKPNIPEGKAELLQRFEMRIGPKIMAGKWAEFWEVKFIDDGYVCGRWVIREKE
jgi:hypothetical protein